MTPLGGTTAGQFSIDIRHNCPYNKHTGYKYQPALQIWEKLSELRQAGEATWE